MKSGKKAYFSTWRLNMETCWVPYYSSTNCTYRLVDDVYCSLGSDALVLEYVDGLATTVEPAT